MNSLFCRWTFVFLRNIVLCYTFITYLPPAKAQGTLPGGFKHIIEVGRYSDWGKGYLTITDDNAVKIGNSRLYQHYTYEYVDQYKYDNNTHLDSGQLILEVDGVSAYNWTKDDFYNKVDGRRDVIELKIRARKDTCIYEYITKIRPLYELPDDVKIFGNAFALLTGKTWTELREEENRRVNRGARFGTGLTFEVRNDEEFDFFPCFTFDFLLSSNDPLRDKEILNSIPYARYSNRNEQSPDILFTIAKDAGEKISSTYIPPSSRIINEGSTTYAQYNYITHQNDYITKQKNRTIYEGGYTQETRTADMFLEIAALDVKKLNDPKITYPPIVWQATVKRHLVDYNFDLHNEMRAWAAWMFLPLGDRNVSTGPKIVYAPTGVLFSDYSPKVIREVIRGSRAEQIGLQPGDILIKADMPYGNKWARKDVKKLSKTKGWAMVDAYLDQRYNIEIQRNGKKMKMTLFPNSIEASRNYLVGAK